jgi:hypothetical protein
MPKAIEIRVDPILKCVVIDTNFPNREVNGASWAPKLFHLGWDTPEEIWEEMQDTVPTMICFRMRLSCAGRVLSCAYDFTDETLIQTLKQSIGAYPAREDVETVAGMVARYHRSVKPPLPDPPHHITDIPDDSTALGIRNFWDKVVATPEEKSA